MRKVDYTAMINSIINKANEKNVLPPSTVETTNTETSKKEDHETEALENESRETETDEIQTNINENYKLN